MCVTNKVEQIYTRQKKKKSFKIDNKLKVSQIYCIYKTKNNNIKLLNFRFCEVESMRWRSE